MEVVVGGDGEMGIWNRMFFKIKIGHVCCEEGTSGYC